VQYELTRIEGSDQLQVEVKPTFTLQDCEHLHAPSFEVRGPTGPNTGKMELTSAKVIRANGEEEEITPDQ
jgi:hypothetical protein